MLETIVTLLFGSPRALFLLQVLGTLNALTPCPNNGPVDDVACMADHQAAAAVIATVALEDNDPNEAAAILEGAGGHETQFRTKLQKHGPAITWWQLEVRTTEERERYLADDLAAARRALAIARTCKGSMVGYASGNCASKAPRVLEAAGQLRRCIESARRGGAWVCRGWVSPPKPKSRKRGRKGTT